MVGKIYYKEPQRLLKGYIKKQDIYCVVCKKGTDNKSIMPKQVINKSIPQKSICVKCGSKKLVFVK